MTGTLTNQQAICQAILTLYSKRSFRDRLLTSDLVTQIEDEGITLTFQQSGIFLVAQIKGKQKFFSISAKSLFKEYLIDAFNRDFSDQSIDFSIGDVDSKLDIYISHLEKENILSSSIFSNTMSIKKERILEIMGNLNEDQANDLKDKLDKHVSMFS